jgi:glycosyltransferase involved in cell wall biosynthesis
MHIALVANARVPVAGYGGTERVVTWLGRALVEMGHRITLIASPGSTMPGATVVEASHRSLQERDFDVTSFLPPGVDIVHSHRQFRVLPPVPLLWTLHGNPPPGTELPPNTIFVSANHARRYGHTAYVHNGLDLAEYRYRDTKADYDLFLGRLHSVKGYRWAIEAARRTGRKLVLAGGWRPSFRRGISFAGRVAGERKAELLAGARCLWMPALWDEPFGLTLIEALASGTPVIGTHRGSLPEIISPDVGFLGDSVDELVGFAGRLGEISPADCRARVEEHFSHRVMAARYVAYYEAALGGIDRLA